MYILGGLHQLLAMIDSLFSVFLEICKNSTATKVKQCLEYQFLPEAWKQVIGVRTDQYYSENLKDDPAHNSRVSGRLLPRESLHLSPGSIHEMDWNGETHLFLLFRWRLDWQI